MKILVPRTRAAGLPVAARISRIIEIPAVAPFTSCAGISDLKRPGKGQGGGR